MRAKGLVDTGAVIALLDRAGLRDARAHRDLGGHERVVEAKRG